MTVQGLIRLCAAALTAFAVAGCEPVQTTSSGTVRPVPTAQPAPAAAPPRVELPPEARSMARTFVQVMNRVEPVAEQICRNRARGVNCDFHIVVDDRPGQPPNAFQTVDPQGRPIIAFTLSLIAETRNADEIAFILAHEAAHHIEGHISRQQRNATVGAVVFGRLAGATGGDADAIRSAQELGAALGARGYSKEFELEADRLGTIIAARAGFDPVRGADFFFRIPDPGDRFLGTHPPNAERVQMVRQTAAGL